MSIVEVIFSAVLNIFSIYIDFRIINFFLDKKELKKQFPFFIYELTWGINWGISNLFDNVYLTSITLFVILLIATMMIYQGSLFRKLVAVFSSMALGIVVDDIIWRSFSYFGLIEEVELFANLITSLILMVLILLLERFFCVDKTKYITKESYINIMIVLLGNVLLIYILWGIASEVRLEIMLALIIICVIDISTFSLQNKVNEVYREKLEHQMMEEQILMYKKQFGVIRQSQKKIESLQHDIKKHLYLLDSYLKKGNSKAAETYIQEIEKYINVSGQYVNTGNQEIDAILNYSLEKADKMDCRIETKITVPDSSFINEFDLNMLLGNLLDNALDALEKVEERYLYVGISFHNGLMLIRMWNSFDGVVDKDGAMFKSRKEERTMHGIGLQNIRDIVNKYDGAIKIDTTKNLFKIDIILYLQ